MALRGTAREEGRRVDGAQGRDPLRFQAAWACCGQKSSASAAALREVGGGGGRFPNVSTGKTNSCWLKLTCAARDSYTCLHARALCTHSTSACRCYASVHMYVHMHTHIYTHEQPQIRLTTPCACMCPDATCALCKQAYFLSHAPDLGARVQLPKAWHAAVRLLAVIPNSA